MTASHRSGWFYYTSEDGIGFGRLKVDAARTSFYEGREFRSFKELNIAASATYVIKVVVPINIILSGLEFSLDSGWLRASSAIGGTEGGSFSETLPRIMANNMSGGVDHRNDYSGAVYQPQTTITAGGTHTGGTELDVVRVKVSGISTQAITVGSTPSDERGIAANTYYFRLLNLSGTDTITGTFKVRWEERG